MYMGNPLLRKAGEKLEYTQEMIQEYIKCKEDIVYFAEHYFYIVTLDEGRRLISLYEYQKKILKAYVETPCNKRHCIVKIARQSGKTTVSTIFLLWYALFNKDKTIAILAHQEKLAKEILEKIKMAFRNLPLWLQQGIEEGGWNQTSLVLENGSRLLCAATGSESITGFAVNLLYLDEFAKVPKHVAEEFISSTYPTISTGKTSKIVMISTPKGMNHFYEFWTKAVKGMKPNADPRKSSDFYPIRVGWWEVPGRTEEWKEKEIANINPIRFAQEYSCKFLGSSTTLVDSDVLERIEHVDPISSKWTGMFSIYEEPIKDNEYIMGVDTAKGTGKDYSVIQVLKVINEHELKQVAVYRNNMISPHEFAQVCISVSNYYNKSLMMIENNDIGEALCNAIWYEYDCDRIINLDPKGLGIRSNRKTKLEANLLLKDYMERGKLEIVDQSTIYELSRYEEITPNVFACGSGDNDDTVTALLWALYYVITDFYEGRSGNIKKIDNRYKLDGEDEGPVAIFD